jgi:group I intron endonuclease
MVIYKITNIENNKVYIGQTIQPNPKMRWYSHQADARRGRKSHLYDSIRKYGVEKFIWEIIDVAKTIEELNVLEAKWVDHYRDIGIVYNNREAGNNKTHSKKSIDLMKEVQRISHARRRENGTEGGWKRRDGGPMKGKTQPRCSCLKCKKEISTNIFFKNHGNKCGLMVFNPTTCPHCSLIGAGPNMKRYHFDKCKMKENT